MKIWSFINYRVNLNLQNPQINNVMKLKIRISFLLVLTTLAFTACQSKQPQPQKNETKNETKNQNWDNVTGDDHPDVKPNNPKWDTDVYDVVEQMPVFPGGDKKLLEFISKQLKYPAIAKENGIQGTVIVRFVVTNTGKVEKSEVLRSLDPECDKEAIRVVASLPRWIPGKQNGVNVASYYTLPIKFKMQ